MPIKLITCTDWDIGLVCEVLSDNHFTNNAFESDQHKYSPKPNYRNDVQFNLYKELLLLQEDVDSTKLWLKELDEPPADKIRLLKALNKIHKETNYKAAQLSEKKESHQYYMAFAKSDLFKSLFHPEISL